MADVSIHLIRAQTVREMDCARLAQCMPARYERAQRFRLERDRLLCLGAGLLMMDVLGITNERQIRFGAYGRPYVPGLGSFSISHSGSVCILARGGAAHLGADIERIDERNIDVADAVYTAREREWMEAEPLERFYRLWTWKESVMKATGRGMSLEPRSFEVLPFARGRSVQVQGRSWYAWGMRLGDSCLSVCADEPIGSVRLAPYGGTESASME